MYILIANTSEKTKSPTPKCWALVGEDGFEPSKRNAADLQSVPFGHSGTPPYSVGVPTNSHIIARKQDLSIGF